jgi:hypothetical protein
MSYFILRQPHDAAGTFRAHDVRTHEVGRNLGEVSVPYGRWAESISAGSREPF